MAEKRKQREGRQARAAICEAAAAVFAQKGFHGATLDEIARSAGYTPPALYRYFASKRALYLAVMDQLHEEINAVFDEPLPVALAFEDRLRWLLARHFQVVQSRQHQVAAFLQQRAVLEWDMRSELGAAVLCRYREALERLVALFDEGVREGALRDLPTADLAAAYAGIVKEMTLRWFMSEGEEPLDANIDRIVDLFLRGAGTSGEDDA